MSMYIYIYIYIYIDCGTCNLTLCFRQEKNMSVVEHLLCGMNALCRAVAIDCRTQVCRLGEGIAKGLFFIWHSRPSEPLKVSSNIWSRLQGTTK